MKNFLFALFLILLPGFGLAQNIASTATPLTDVPQVVFPELDNKELYKEELERRGPGIAPRFAENIEVNISPATHGVWEVLSNRTAVWRLRLYSKGAKSLNLGFTQFLMPQGGQLLLYNPNNLEQVYGPFTPADNEEHEQLWTPIIPGEELVIEVQVPEKKMHELQLELKSVNHDFMGFGEAILSGSCNIDVICGADDGLAIIDDYRDIIQSVAVISTGGNTICTGFLINNERNDCTPYFMTAWHCGIGNNNAPSLVAYWNYQNSICREPGSSASGGNGDGTLNDFNTGSTFRAGWSNSDFVLVEFDDPVSETADGFFAGWTIEDTPPEGTVICVHHPNTDEKRISFEYDDTYLGLWSTGSSPNANGNHVIVPDWDEGTTEGGSSGAPLFDSNKRVVGQLHGGTASCNSNTYDSYGWFTSSWTGGGTSSTRLSDWLDPDGTGIIELDGREVAQCGINVNVTNTNVTICGTGDAVFDLEVSDGFTSDVTLSLIGLPGTATSTFTVNPVAPGGTSVLTISNIGSLSTGVYTFTLESTDGTEIASLDLSFTILDGAPANTSLLFPIDASIDAGIQPEFNWDAVSGAIIYELEIALDAGFTNVVALIQDIEGTTFDGLVLSSETLYFWRVRAINECGESDWSTVFSFTTVFADCLSPAATDVPVNIPSGGYPVVTSTLDFASGGSISDVDVIGLNGVHTWVGDLTITITSPEGTTVVLVDQICGYDENFNFSFDDDAASANIPCPPTTGLTYQPVGNLDNFNGENPQGPWILTISDNADYDGGQLNGWGLTVCTSAEEPGISAFPALIDVCDTENATYTVVVNGGFSGPVTLNASGQPAGSSVTFSPNPAAPGSNVTATVSGLSGTGGFYGLTFEATDGTSTTAFSVDMDVTPNPGPATLELPADDATNVVLQPTLTWAADPNAVEYTVELASDPNFSNLLASSTTTNTTLALSFQLDQSTEYFWRVFSDADPCFSAISEVFSFRTEGPNSLEELNGQALRIQPNPTNGPVQIAFAQPLTEMVYLEVFSIDGKALMQANLQPGTLAYSLNLNNLADGVYVLHLKSADQVFVKRLILQD